MRIARPMKNRPTLNPRIASIVVATALTATIHLLGIEAQAQNSSLLHAPPPSAVLAQPQRIDPGSAQLRQQQPATGNHPVATAGQGSDRPTVFINGASWTHLPSPPMRSFAINDVVTIRVDEITRMAAEGSAESRKRTLYEAALTEWIRIADFRLRPDPQGNGDPTVSTESNNNYRAQSSVESRESMSFNIAATVVDIRPNGLLVLEARKQIRANDNLWETSLTGICRAQDIAPDNVVLSKDLIDLEIHKDDRGHLRDGYKRGWFQRWFDRVQPF